MVTQAISYLGSEQYLELERRAQFPSEHIEGQTFAMAGGWGNHATIAGNTFGLLFLQLRDKPCRAVGSDLCFPSQARDFYTVKYKPGATDIVVDASVVEEVLSPGTQSYDRGDKFIYYRGLPSLSEYLLISQDAIEAEHRSLQPDGSWLTRFYADRSETLDLTSIGCKLVLGEIYDRIEFDSAE